MSTFYTQLFLSPTKLVVDTAAVLLSLTGEGPSTDAHWEAVRLLSTQVAARVSRMQCDTQEGGRHETLQGTHFVLVLYCA